MSEGGLSVLHQNGIAISKSTQRREMYKSAENHNFLVRDFIQEGIVKKALLVFMVDDFTNIHTKGVQVIRIHLLQEIWQFYW